MTKLFKEVKASCVKHLIEGGISKEAISEILFVFHTVSFEFFTVIEKEGFEKMKIKKVSL